MNDQPEEDGKAVCVVGAGDAIARRFARDGHVACVGCRGADAPGRWMVQGQDRLDFVREALAAA
jgi:hypothetical protein